MFRRRLLSRGTTFGLLAFAALPAMANHIDNATVTVGAGCSSYTIAVSGGALDHPDGRVDYTFTVTSSGSSKTINGSFPVNPQSGSNLSFTKTVTAIPLGNGYVLPAGATLTGIAKLYTGNTFWNSRTIIFPFTAPCLVPPPASCASKSSITSKLNENNVKKDTYLWFSAVVNVTGMPTSAWPPTQLFFQNSTITIGNTQYPVPNGVVIFGAAPETKFVDTNMGWRTFAPLSGVGDIFLTGFTLKVPGPISANTSVTWVGNFTATAPNLAVTWKWSSTAFTQFSDNYNALMIKPATMLSLTNNWDAVGTPEAFKTYGVSGGTCGGGCTKREDEDGNEHGERWGSWGDWIFDFGSSGRATQQCWSNSKKITNVCGTCPDGMPMCHG